MRAINRVQPARVSRWPPRSRIHKETALGLLCSLSAMQGSQLDVRQAAHYGLKYLYTDQSVFKHLKHYAHGH